MPPLQYLRLIDVQARMALKADASKFLLGYLWWILEPLLYVLVFYVVFDLILDRRKADIIVFLMCGKFPFIWFARTVNQSSNSIVANVGLIGRVNVPKSLFPMAAVQANLYKQAVVFAFLIGFVLFRGYEPTLGWLWLLPIIAVQYILILACALAGAIAVVYIRDFSMAISLLITFLLFTSGIFWDVRDIGNPDLTELILLVNPLAFLLDAYREVLMYGGAPELEGLVRNALLFSALTLLMLAYLRRTSQSLALRALS
ncbi:MAG: ABC transporter permease [Pseudomonadota bacterium]